MLSREKSSHLAQCFLIGLISGIDHTSFHNSPTRLNINDDLRVVVKPVLQI